MVKGHISNFLSLSSFVLKKEGNQAGRPLIYYLVMGLCRSRNRLINYFVVQKYVLQAVGET